jgi:hypothetical protein
MVNNLRCYALQGEAISAMILPSRDCALPDEISENMLLSMQDFLDEEL